MCERCLCLNVGMSVRVSLCVCVWDESVFIASYSTTPLLWLTFYSTSLPVSLNPRLDLTSRSQICINMRGQRSGWVKKIVYLKLNEGLKVKTMRPLLCCKTFLASGKIHNLTLDKQISKMVWWFDDWEEWHIHPTIHQFDIRKKIELIFYVPYILFLLMILEYLK